MTYVAAGYIAVFGTLGVYVGWTIVKARRAAANIIGNEDRAQHRD
jgi:xanthosine utilization system XapX-like protein